MNEFSFLREKKLEGCRINKQSHFFILKMVLPHQTDLKYETKMFHIPQLFFITHLGNLHKAKSCANQYKNATAHASLAYSASKRQSKHIHSQRRFIYSRVPTMNCRGINHDGKRLPTTTATPTWRQRHTEYVHCLLLSRTCFILGHIANN